MIPSCHRITFPAGNGTKQNIAVMFGQCRVGSSENQSRDQPTPFKNKKVYGFHRLNVYGRVYVNTNVFHISSSFRVLDFILIFKNKKLKT